MAMQLWSKMRIKEGQKIMAVNPPEGFAATLGKLPAGTTLSLRHSAGADHIIIFSAWQSELDKQIAAALKKLAPQGHLWSCFPKKTSGIPSDISRDSAWGVYQKYPMRGITLIAVDDKWSAFAFRHGENQMGTPKPESAGSKQFIDAENRMVTLPKDVATALKKAPAARELFDKLSFSHRKEYILWVVEAKKEETRKTRVAAMVEKLLSGKKNPSAK